MPAATTRRRSALAPQRAAAARSALLATAALLPLLTAAAAPAATPRAPAARRLLVTSPLDLPFPVTGSWTTLPIADDVSSPAIPLPSPLTVLGVARDNVWMNTNGACACAHTPHWHPLPTPSHPPSLTHTHANTRAHPWSTLLHSRCADRFLKYSCCCVRSHPSYVISSMPASSPLPHLPPFTATACAL